jgi:hypothetical protein
MSSYGFGGPRGGIIQMAYTVPDIRAAIDYWIGDLKVGPWFLLDHFTGTDPIYRGEISKADVSIAMSFAGHMNVELIQPNDRNPSVYRDAIERKGYGFHHFGRASEDIEADVAELERQGYQQAFRAGVPTGGEVVYLESDEERPGFVELIQATETMDQAFTAMWRNTVGWDGRDPIRPFG